MDDILKVDPVYDHFSKNKYLDTYKQNLVSTGNIDHIIPFKHSQNKTGLKMNYLRQNNSPKLYPVSASQELAKEYFHKSNQEPVDDEIGFSYPLPKKEVSLHNQSKQDQPNKLPKVGSNLSRHVIAEEGPETIHSEKTSSVHRGSRGSFTSSIRGRFGQKKGKEISEKEKVDKLVKVYFK